jgi:hypothetical protein
MDKDGVSSLTAKAVFEEVAAQTTKASVVQRADEDEKNLIVKNLFVEIKDKFELLSTCMRK